MLTLLTYLAVGAILMFLMLNTEKSTEGLSKAYIKYRTEAIAEGRPHSNEITFRRVFITALFIISMIAWPLILCHGVYKVITR